MGGRRGRSREQAAGRCGSGSDRRRALGGDAAARAAERQRRPSGRPRLRERLPPPPRGRPRHGAAAVSAAAAGLRLSPRPGLPSIVPGSGGHRAAGLR